MNLAEEIDLHQVRPLGVFRRRRSNRLGNSQAKGPQEDVTLESGCDV